MDVNTNPAYGFNVHASNPARRVSSQEKDKQQLPTGDNLYVLHDTPAISDEVYDVVILPTDTNTNKDDGGSGAVQVDPVKNTNSHKASLFIGIALSTAVLALVVAMVSVGLQISALKANISTQYGILNETVHSVQETIREHSDLLNKLNPKGSFKNPATSCSEIPTDRPSGEYWIVGNSSSVQVYCDMNRTCCNTTGGWMRVANLDMTDSNQQCPDGFLLHNEMMTPLRTCGRPGPPGCVSTTFPVYGIEYSGVCGRVIGYQYGSPDAFHPFFNDSSLTINDTYVEGVSLTHGQLPRKHIWTFAAAVDEAQSPTIGYNNCPCTRSDITYTGLVPPFISQDYFCDTGRRNVFKHNTFHSDDPLWNGQGCGGTSTCCSFNNPPWFCKHLPQPTTDNIELRLCADQLTSSEDIFLELVDIFVQ